MLKVTETALSHLAGALGRIEGPKPDKACFRIISTDDGRLTLTVDTPARDDTEYGHDGTTVLVLADEVRDRCEGRTLDSDNTGNLVLT